MDGKFIIAVDLGGTNLKIALLNLRYRILYRKILMTKRFVSKESLIDAIVIAIKNVIQEKKLNKTNTLGIGLGLPGPIDVQEGRVHFFPNIPGWKDVGLKDILAKKLKLPVYLDNDANLMSLAEHRMGAARGAKNAICITLVQAWAVGLSLGVSFIAEKVMLPEK